MATSRSRGGRWLTTLSPMRISPLRDVLQPRDHAQRRRLAAAGRADQRHELLVGDLEIDVLHGVKQRPVMLVELAECDRCHCPAVTEPVMPSKKARRELPRRAFAFDYCAALLTSGRALGQHLRDVLALAGDGLGDGVVERLVHRGPLREVIGAAHLVGRIEHRFLQQLHERILRRDLRPELGVGRRRAGRLEQLLLAFLVEHHGFQHLLGELLALGRDRLRDRPAPDIVPGERLGPVGAEREARGGDLAGDFRLGRIVERAPPQRVRRR